MPGRPSCSRLGHPQIPRSGDPERGSALQEVREGTGFGFAATRGSPRARSSGLGARQTGEVRSRLLPLSRSPPACALLSETATGLVVCGVDGGLPTPGGKPLDGAPARVGPKAVTQWTQEKTGSWVIKPTVFLCLWVRERGLELAHGVSLKDETSEKRNFKGQEGYSQTEGRTVRSTGQAWSVLSRIL